VRQRDSKSSHNTAAPLKRNQASAIEDIIEKRKLSKKKKDKHKRSDSSESSISHDGDEFQEPDEYDRYTNYDEDQINNDIPETDMEDIKRCVVSRSKLEKWYGEPYFMKNVPGLLVRVVSGGIGGSKSYKIAEIINIVETNKTYKLGKKECRHLASLKIGESIKKYEMEYVSNASISEFEYLQWLDVARKGNEIPTKDHIESLVDQIYQSDHYIYTDADFREQIKKK